MSNVREMESYIPIRICELIDSLCADNDLPTEQRASFRHVCRLLGLLFHYDYNQRLEQLKASYFPFDPDADTRSMQRIGADAKLAKMNAFFSDMGSVLEEAGYRHLSSDALMPTLHQASAWGLRMDVDFSAFERLAIFVRGSTTQKRPLRQLRKGLRTEEKEVAIYQRVIMLLKLRPHPRVGKHIDTNCLYLQLFKNIPHLDINMVLPGARVRMSYFDRSRIGLPILSGLGLTLWQVMQDITGAVVHFIREFILFQPAAIWAAASGAFGYGFKSYYGYHQTRQRYVLSLMQLLYFQNLDTNAGVLYRLIDEAEEQDAREAILTYYYLWRLGGADGWNISELRTHAEQDLVRRANLRIDFEIETCLVRLEKSGLVTRVNDRFHALPLDRAVEQLQAAWSSVFKAVERHSEIRANRAS